MLILMHTRSFSRFPSQSVSSRADGIGTYLPLHMDAFSGHLRGLSLEDRHALGETVKPEEEKKEEEGVIVKAEGEEEVKHEVKGEAEDKKDIGEYVRERVSESCERVCVCE